MATVGHLAIGAAAARWLVPRTASHVALLGTMALFAGLSLAPDLDAIGFVLGVPYGAPWGHRGAAHSPLLACAVAVLAGLVLPGGAGSRSKTILTLCLVVGSHGVIDTFTDGGLGTALLWPLTSRRFVAPWRPLPVAPIGGRLLSRRGVRVLVWELFLFLPLLVYAFWPRGLPAVGAATPLSGRGGR
jgi:inner membrane protein